MYIFKNYILFIFAISTINAYAQKGFEVGGHVGAAWYSGDLNLEFKLNSPGYLIGPFIRYNYDERLSLKAGLDYLLLRGSDRKSDNIFNRARNLSFNNHVFELNVNGELNFLRYEHGSRYEWYTPYILFGASVMRTDPIAKLDGEWYRLRDLGTEGQKKGKEYAGFAGAWSFGFGFKADLSNVWSMNVEIQTKQTMTDYLDDVSENYPNNAQLLADRGMIAVALSDPSILIPGYNDGPIGHLELQRGDSTNKDGFATLSIGLCYYFAKVRCPEILK